MSSSDENLISSAAFIVMSSEARRKKRKRRWRIKTLLKKLTVPTLLGNLSMEDGSGSRNFTKMRASYFELLAIITGFKVSRQDTNYRKSTTVNEITFDLLFFLLVDSIKKCEHLICKLFGHFYVVSIASRLLGVSYFSSFTPILSQKGFHFLFKNVYIISCVQRHLLHLSSYFDFYKLLT
jgi:hypothetical protein